MKTSIFTLLLFVCFLPSSVHANHGTIELSLEKLAQQGIVQFSFFSQGGYQESCAALVIKNLSADSVSGILEAGKILNSVNDNEQDLLITEHIKFKLAKSQVDTIPITGYCCQSSKMAPSKGSLFTLSTLSIPALLVITALTSQFKFPKDAVQHAIWTLSDGHDIRSIPAYKNKQMDLLRHSVANYLDIELPWYSFLYDNHAEGQIYNGIKTHFFAEVGIDLPNRALIQTFITNPAGEIVFEGNPHYVSAGEQVVTVKAKLSDWPAGNYTLWVMEDFHTTNRRLGFNLE